MLAPKKKKLNYQRHDINVKDSDKSKNVFI